MINFNETILIGKIVIREGSSEYDEVSKRIKDLSKNYLQKITTDESGWDTLYQDPSDGRYWELTYPNSGMHGGGAPKLECLTKEEVLEKYKV